MGENIPKEYNSSMTSLSFFHRMLRYVRTHKIISIFLVILCGGGYYYASRPAPQPTWDTAHVKRGNIVQEVSVTGNVVPSQNVDLAIERGGRVTLVGGAVGDKVGRGTVLVRTDASETETLLQQAQANLEYEEAKLDELQKGARPEDIRVSEAAVEQAAAAQSDAERALHDKLEDAYTKADDAILNKTDELLRNPRTTYPAIDFPLSDGKLATEIENMRVTVGGDLTAWRVLVSDLEIADTAQTTKKTEEYLGDVKAYLDKLAFGVNTVSPTASVSQTTADSWKLAVSTARTTIATTLSGVIAAENTYRATASALVVAQDQLSLKRSGATPEALAAQIARIAAQKALIANYNAQIAKFSIIAPFAGIVTRQDAKRGASVGAGTSLVSLEGGTPTVEANIPEVDVAKVKVGDAARITLDAYGSDVPFTATVVKINPAETVIEGIPTYKTTFHFNEPDTRIRSGMTADIDIQTATRPDVLMIPSRAITTDDNGKFVRIPTQDQSGMATTTAVRVETGLRGSDGMIEILSGLSEGDTVITFMGE